MNFKRLVLGCIEAKFGSQILVGISYLFEKKIEKRDMGKALDEIYKIYILLHRSDLDISQ